MPCSRTRKVYSSGQASTSSFEGEKRMGFINFLLLRPGRLGVMLVFLSLAFVAPAGAGLAVGDAVEIKELVTGASAIIALAGPANKQGRIAADNAMGRQSVFKGAQATAIVKIFDMTAASTGASEKVLKKNNVPYLSSYTHSDSQKTPELSHISTIWSTTDFASPTPTYPAILTVSRIPYPVSRIPHPISHPASRSSPRSHPVNPVDPVKTPSSKALSVSRGPLGPCAVPPPQLTTDN